MTMPTVPPALAPGDEVHETDTAHEQERDAVPAGADGKQRRTQADVLIELGGKADLFHAPDGVAFASLEIDGHRETHAIHRKVFRQWLTRTYYKKEERAPGSQALQDALGVLEARARFDGKEIPTWLRIGEANGAIYLDLGDEKWKAVKITADGWEVVPEAGCRFRRAPGLRPLPVPSRGGSITSLRNFVNVADDRDFRLLVGFLLATFSPTGPFPLVDFQGEQGSAKTSAARFMRELIDPASVPLRTMPRDERDLHIAATNGWLLTFDNVSRLTPWISDALCRLATGGGFSTRQLYTDQDEVLFDVQRPVILTGIEDVVERDDLRDRAIIVTLPTIPDHARKDERTLWAAFERVRPDLVGAMLDAVSTALRDLDHVDLADLPRMADFARWVTAGERAFGWTPGAILEAYLDNRGLAVRQFLDGDRFATEIVKYITEIEVFTGTSTALLDVLNNRVLERDRGPNWPKTARGLSGQLRRIAPALRGDGFDVTPGGRRRTLTVQKREVSDRADRADSDSVGDIAQTQPEPPHGVETEGARLHGQHGSSPTDSSYELIERDAMRDGA